MKIVFMGSPEFAVPTLNALATSMHDVVAVYSQPPRPSGRGQKVRKTPVHELAEKYDIPVFTPEKLQDDAVDTLTSLKPDLIIVVAYGLILPESVLNIAPSINLHPSALPKWRGAAPMNYPILNGERETDICIMQMEKGLDSGPVYLRESYNIGENETAGELHDRFKDLGAKHMLHVVDHWAEYKNSAVPQGGETCYAHKFKPQELKQLRTLDFTQSALEIHNQVCGLSPWPGAIFEHEGHEIKVLKSEVAVKTYEGQSGVVCDARGHKFFVQTHDGIIAFTELKRAGKRAMSADDFLKGYPINVGDQL
ncbi:MAG: methionyl-tRNA formyltransferase [Alphaproteobacteria bacterium]|jgi:methionyl-tRNA formyltransferase